VAILLPFRQQAIEQQMGPEQRLQLHWSNHSLTSSTRIITVSVLFQKLLVFVLLQQLCVPWQEFTTSVLFVMFSKWRSSLQLD